MPLKPVGVATPAGRAGVRIRQCHKTMPHVTVGCALGVGCTACISVRGPIPRAATISLFLFLFGTVASPALFVPRVALLPLQVCVTAVTGSVFACRITHTFQASPSLAGKAPPVSLQQCLILASPHFVTSPKCMLSRPFCASPCYVAYTTITLRLGPLRMCCWCPSTRTVRARLAWGTNCNRWLFCVATICTHTPLFRPAEARTMLGGLRVYTALFAFARACPKDVGCLPLCSRCGCPAKRTRRSVAEALVWRTCPTVVRTAYQ